VVWMKYTGTRYESPWKMNPKPKNPGMLCPLSMPNKLLEVKSRRTHPLCVP